MQYYKHARKSPLQPHYEPFISMGGGVSDTACH